MSWNKSLQSPVLKGCYENYITVISMHNLCVCKHHFFNGLWNTVLIKGNGVNLGGGVVAGGSDVYSSNVS